MSEITMYRLTELQEEFVRRTLAAIRALQQSTQQEAQRALGASLDLLRKDLSIPEDERVAVAMDGEHFILRVLPSESPALSADPVVPLSS